jgi:uncharacterized membrane protein HdeD (DUF308 family)
MGTAPRMAAGIVLIIIGAVFAFALKAESSWLDTRALGLILILGGAAFIWRSRVRKREVVTRETESADGATETEQTAVVERRVE